MAEIQEAPPAKIVIGIMYTNDHLLALTLYTLVQQFGPIEINGPTIPFTFTTYYEEEMGKDIQKTYISFAKKIPQESLPSIKHFTNTLEQKYTIAGKRKINIDPGYLAQHQLVLASAKEHPYRIYLSCGIYGQIILIYTKQGWQTLEKTFKDYQQKEVQEFLTTVRENLNKSL